MVAFPPCKINLGLNVIARRGDGYHEIETCFHQVPWTDILEIIPSNSPLSTFSGSPVPGPPEENLCVTAVRLMRSVHGIPPVSIHLHKIIPLGAGLGGGSSDAAWTVRLVDELFGLNLSDNHLRSLAVQLGSDCPFFIHDEPMMGGGRGEILTPVSFTLSGKYIVIVKPDVQISTAQAYKNIAPRRPSRGIRDIIENEPLSAWEGLLVNDFERHVLQAFPVIREFKDKLYRMGALYASMSGSGSAVYGIFDRKVHAAAEFPGSGPWEGWL